MNPQAEAETAEGRCACELCGCGLVLNCEAEAVGLLDEG